MDSPWFCRYRYLRYRFIRWRFRFLYTDIPNKHLFVSKTSWGCLENMSWRPLEDMSSRTLQDVFSVTTFCLPRRFQDVLNMYSKRLPRCLQDAFKTSSRRLQDILGYEKLLRWKPFEGVFKTCLEDVFKRSWRPTNVSWVFIRGPYAVANVQRSKVVSCKNPFFVIGPFCTTHSVCLKISFWQGSFVWKLWVFKRSTFNWKWAILFLKKCFRLSKNLLQIIKYVQNFLWLPQQNYLKQRATSKIPSTVFIGNNVYSVGFKMKPLWMKTFLRQKKNQLPFCRKTVHFLCIS